MLHQPNAARPNSSILRPIRVRPISRSGEVVVYTTVPEKFIQGNVASFHKRGPHGGSGARGSPVLRRGLDGRVARVRGVRLRQVRAGSRVAPVALAVARPVVVPDLAQDLRFSSGADMRFRSNAN